MLKNSLEYVHGLNRANIDTTLIDTCKQIAALLTTLLEL